jgi:alpha-L-fucosidase 2
MGRMTSIHLVLLCVAGGWVGPGRVGAEPRREHGLHYTEPARVWDEALLLGNGLLGALVWGDGKTLRISLDRTDLWDLRPVPEFSGPDLPVRTSPGQRLSFTRQ